jgi:hypothetical protein
MLSGIDANQAQPLHAVRRAKSNFKRNLRAPGCAKQKEGSRGRTQDFGRAVGDAGSAGDDDPGG